MMKCYWVSYVLALVLWRPVQCSILLSSPSQNKSGVNTDSDENPKRNDSSNNNVVRQDVSTDVKTWRKTWMGLGSAAVAVDWAAVSKRERASGYSLSVGSALWTLLEEPPSYTLPALRPHQEYLAILMPVGGHNSYNFPFTTPALLSDKNLHNLMRENRMKNCSGDVKITEVSLSVKLEGVGRGGLVLEVFDLSSTRPLQWVDVPEDSKVAFISGLYPDMFLKLSLKHILSSDPLVTQDVLTRTIFTGGCVSPPTNNLTRTLDLFFPTKSNNRWSVRCYADDEVFSGFPCHNSDVCVPINWMCDNEEDCPDGDDEDRCGVTHHTNSYCRKNEFRCVRRREHVCLPISWLCDGRDDCSDGWDEEPRNCRGYYGRPGGLHFQGMTCRDSYFRCRNDLGCVAPKFLCDGEHDCADGSDEWNCDSDYHHCDSFREFQCFNSWGRERCIPQTWMCDDQEDCEKGEDEDFDICRRVL